MRIPSDVPETIRAQLTVALRHGFLEIAKKSRTPVSTGAQLSSQSSHRTKQWRQNAMHPLVVKSGPLLGYALVADDCDVTPPEEVRSSSEPRGSLRHDRRHDLLGSGHRDDLGCRGIIVRGGPHKATIAADMALAHGKTQPPEQLGTNFVARYGATGRGDTAFEDLDKRHDR